MPINSNTILLQQDESDNGFDTEYQRVNRDLLSVNRENMKTRGEIGHTLLPRILLSSNIG